MIVVHDEGEISPLRNNALRVLDGLEFLGEHKNHFLRRNGAERHHAQPDFNNAGGVSHKRHQRKHSIASTSRRNAAEANNRCSSEFLHFHDGKASGRIGTR